MRMAAMLEIFMVINLLSNLFTSTKWLDIPFEVYLIRILFLSLLMMDTCTHADIIVLHFCHFLSLFVSAFL
jgi:hypothetical protein